MFVGLFSGFGWFAFGRILGVGARFGTYEIVTAFYKGFSSFLLLLKAIFRQLIIGRLLTADLLTMSHARDLSSYLELENRSKLCFFKIMVSRALAPEQSRKICTLIPVLFYRNLSK